MLGRGKAHFGCALVPRDAERLEPQKSGDEVVGEAVKPLAVNVVVVGVLQVLFVERINDRDDRTS